MTQLLKRTPLLCVSLVGVHLLACCSLSPTQKKTSAPAGSSPATLINTVNKSAVTYRAKYGTDYENYDKVIAKYPHFDLTLFSKKTLASGKDSIHVYELTSKDGLGKKHISCDTRHFEKKHFQLEGLHFYYHSNAIGLINIYMPSQLLASR